MAKYRKKPVVIEAIQFIDTPERLEELSKFIDNQPLRVDYKNPNKPVLKLQTLEGEHIASVGDYIIKGVKGEFYPCKPDIFEQTYEKADSEILKLSWVDDFSLFAIGFTSAAVLIAFMGKQIINLCILVPLLLLTFILGKWGKKWAKS